MTGLDRGHAPAATKEVTSPAVGFTAPARITSGSARAFGVDDAKKTACGLGQVGL